MYESSFQLLQSLGAFSNLTTLYLRYNDFRGRILDDGKLYYIYIWAELQNLIENFEKYNIRNTKVVMFIYLGLIEKFNLLFLFFWAEMQNLSSLESLYLDGCSLDEHSLQSLGALPSLKNLTLQAFSGSVPFRGKLTNLNSTITYHWPFYFSKTPVFASTQWHVTIRCVCIEFLFYVFAIY